MRTLALLALVACHPAGEAPTTQKPTTDGTAWLGTSRAPSPDFVALPAACQQQLMAWIARPLPAAVAAIRRGELGLDDACAASAHTLGVYDPELRRLCSDPAEPLCDTNVAYYRAGVVQLVVGEPPGARLPSAVLADQFAYIYLRLSTGVDKMSEHDRALRLAAAALAIAAVGQRHPDQVDAHLLEQLVFTFIAFMDDPTDDPDHAAAAIIAAARKRAHELGAATLAASSASSDAYLLAVLTAGREGDFASLASLVDKWLASFPNTGAAHYWHALVLTRGGDSAGARKELETAQPLAPKDTAIAAALAAYRSNPDARPSFDVQIPMLVDAQRLGRLEALPD